MNKVVVTGLGFATSIGNDRATVMANLRQLRHGIRPFADFAGADSPVTVAAPVLGFDVSSLDPEDWSFPGELRVRREILRGMSPHVAYAWYAVQQAIADAALSAELLSHPGTGLYAASAGSPRTLHAMMSRMEQFGVARVSPMAIVSSIAGTLNFNLVAHLQILGSSCGFTSACASSSHALGFAFDEIATGRQERMIVVGAEDCNRESLLPFASMRALSLQTDPDRASRPFDRDRDGFVGTGGAVVLILESQEIALNRGATPYCELAGWGQASDGHNVAMSHPEGEGLERAMRLALRHAGLSPEQVDYVNAHATSTSIGDLSEARALLRVFGQNGPWVSSTKALTGHGLSLAGAMEAAFCALCLREGFIPGSANIANLDPACAGLRIPFATQESTASTILSNSSGFGGANVSLVLQKCGAE